MFTVKKSNNKKRKMMTTFKTSAIFMANDYVVIGVAAGLVVGAAYVNVITKIDSLFTTRLKRHVSLLWLINFTFILGKLLTFVCFFRKSYYDLASEKLFLHINLTYSLLSIILHISIIWRLRNITFCVDTVPDCSSNKLVICFVIMWEIVCFCLFCQLTLGSIEFPLFLKLLLSITIPSIQIFYLIYFNWKKKDPNEASKTIKTSLYVSSVLAVIWNMIFMIMTMNVRAVLMTDFIMQDLVLTLFSCLVYQISFILFVVNDSNLAVELRVSSNSSQ